MNAVVMGVIAMLILSLARMNVILSIFIGTIIAGLSGGMALTTTLEAFTEGMGNSAGIAMSYALLGAFAAALSYSGVPGLLAEKLAGTLRNNSRKTKGILLLSILLMAIASQNIIPVHIAFIPILIPPLLATFSQLQLDRRIISSALVFGLCGTYLVVPFGFGNIYLNQILAGNLETNGLTINHRLLPLVMAIPVSGMLVGLLFALFVTYRKKRTYDIIDTTPNVSTNHPACGHYKMVLGIITVALLVQIVTESIMLGALSGFLLLLLAGVVHWQKADSVFIDGIKMMAFAGFVMMAASGFGEVLRHTGDIPELVLLTQELFSDSKAIAALVMLLVGLLITMGIGSSFSTIPIIATIFVPLSLQLGFSPIATAVLLGTAGALGDAGSPASESAIGPTMGLNMDGQHDHIRDTVIPTFLHFNIPMVLFGWAAAMLL
ncbi:hypothetical protein CI610_00926 [invertebrate metagenome]|uniref:Sodium:proton antiporter n=1 Tax=invertebrate metagenome TaxID=1711999 RepID=A0A2H9TA48_9ZZZZ